MATRVSQTKDIVDLLQSISEIQGRTLERVEATHNLAVKTNGRVTKLEKKIIGDEAVTAYKRGQRALYVSLFTAFCALIGGLWWTVGH